MSLLHLLVRDIQLGVTCLVRRDLRGSRSGSIRVGQVGFDLLRTRAGGVEEFTGVAGARVLHPCAAAMRVDPIVALRQE